MAVRSGGRPFLHQRRPAARELDAAGQAAGARPPGGAVSTVPPRGGRRTGERELRAGPRAGLAGAGYLRLVELNGGRAGPERRLQGRLESERLQRTEWLPTAHA